MAALSSQIVRVLSTRIPAARWATMQRVASQRCSNARLVLENISDPHNGDACLRTAEGFGVQHVHAIETHNELALSDSRGYARWLTLHRHNSVDHCYTNLKEAGFKIYTTELSTTSQPMSDVSFDGKVAILLGNENRGVSRAASDAADGQLIIPMMGMTQSFNISVTCALVIQHLQQRGILQAKLSQQEQHDLLAKWLINTVPKPHAHLERAGIVIPDL